MDSLRGGLAMAQIRAGLPRFRCNYGCFPLDCWPICGEDAFQDETSCAKIEVTTFPSTIRQEHCCWIRRHRVPAVCTIRRTHSARLDTPDSRFTSSPIKPWAAQWIFCRRRMVDKILGSAASFILLKAFVTALLRNV